MSFIRNLLKCGKKENSDNKPAADSVAAQSFLARSTDPKVTAEANREPQGSDYLHDEDGVVKDACKIM